MVIEVDYFERKTTRSIITRLKRHFSNHGIPYLFHSDNGQPFDSQEFRDFAAAYELELVFLINNNSNNNNNNILIIMIIIIMITIMIIIIIIIMIIIIIIIIIMKKETCYPFPYDLVEWG